MDPYKYTRYWQVPVNEQTTSPSLLSPTVSATRCLHSLDTRAFPDSHFPQPTTFIEQHPKSEPTQGKTNTLQSNLPVRYRKATRKNNVHPQHHPLAPLLPTRRIRLSCPASRNESFNDTANRRSKNPVRSIRPNRSILVPVDRRAFGMQRG